MKAVVAYCRSACAKQSDPSAEVRLQSQKIRRYAKRLGITIREVYFDAGASSITLDRTELKRLLAACRAGKIAMVITRDPERLTRDTRELVRLMGMFETAKVKVRFTSRAGEQRYGLLKLVAEAIRKARAKASRSADRTTGAPRRAA